MRTTKPAYLVTFCCLLSLSLANAVAAESNGGVELTEEVIDHLGITNPDKLSAASKRALKWPRIGNEWFIEFSVHDLKGDLAYEEGIVRRDPGGNLLQGPAYNSTLGRFVNNSWKPLSASSKCPSLQRMFTALTACEKMH